MCCLLTNIYRQKDIVWPKNNRNVGIISHACVMDYVNINIPQQVTHK